MNKPILYCDCDGVIFNTIEVAFNIMREKGYDVNNQNQRNQFFQHEVEWVDIFDKAKVINDSINKLRYIKESGFFDDVIILTKLSGGYDEERLKRDIFKDLLPEFRVVTLQYGLDKGLVVPARGNILIDDEVRNCQKWGNQNGTPVLFTEYMSDLEKDIIDDLEDVHFTNGVKELLKTRNF